jgi:hypothetical protein
MQMSDRLQFLYVMNVRNPEIPDSKDLPAADSSF